MVSNSWPSSATQPQFEMFGTKEIKEVSFFYFFQNSARFKERLVLNIHRYISWRANVLKNHVSDLCIFCAWRLITSQITVNTPTYHSNTQYDFSFAFRILQGMPKCHSLYCFFLIPDFLLPYSKPCKFKFIFRNISPVQALLDFILWKGQNKDAVILRDSGFRWIANLAALDWRLRSLVKKSAILLNMFQCWKSIYLRTLTAKEMKSYSNR